MKINTSAGSKPLWTFWPAPEGILQRGLFLYLYFLYLYLCLFLCSWRPQSAPWRPPSVATFWLVAIGRWSYQWNRHNSNWLSSFLNYVCTLGCFSKDTLKQKKKTNPVRNWGGPRENIYRRRGWSDKSRGSPKALEVWKKLRIGGGGVIFQS